MSYMVSYSWNAEDVLLNRVFGGATIGFYVDIGAAHPSYESVTRHFSDLGWHGVNVEPQSHLHALLSQARPRDVNLNVGVSDVPGELVLHRSPTFAHVSTLSAEHRDQNVVEAGVDFVAETVEVTTLARIWEEHVGDTTVDFLKIDVEGHETKVLAGGRFDIHRPRVVLVEAIPLAGGHAASAEWEPYLTSAGYEFITYDGVNRYYVRDEDVAALAPALRVPVNVRDHYVPIGLLERIAALGQQRQTHPAMVLAQQLQDPTRSAVHQSLVTSLTALQETMATLCSSIEAMEQKAAAYPSAEELRAVLADVSVGVSR